MDPISQFVMDHLIEVTAELVMPLMAVAFLSGIAVRMLIFYIARMEQKFSFEFEKRARRAVDEMNADEKKRVRSFHRLVRMLLEQTYYECFELRNRFKRRNLDHISSVADRLFLVQDGVARAIEDTLKKTRYLKRESHQGKMVDLTRGVFENNPFFNRLMGVFPVALLNELINILPGLFIIGGIFGTFLGISKGLPELGGMDLSHIEESKRVMDMFLVTISKSMIKSIVGIALSVVMSLINTVFSPDSLYFNMINRFSGTLEQLWDETTTNEYDRSEIAFDARKAVAPPPPAPPAPQMPETDGATVNLDVPARKTG